MKKIFEFKKLSVKELCAVAMLIAVTAVLSIFGTFRIGNAIKIPLKFISVFIASFLFGPWIGGLCGAVGDILNAVLVPVGPIIPLLTLLEFFSGFVFGTFFYLQNTKGKKYVLRALFCTLILFLSDMILTTSVLNSVGYFNDFKTAFIIRLPAGIIKFLMQFLFVLLISKYLDEILKIRGKD